MQTQNPVASNPARGIADAAREIGRRGLGGFYRGVGGPLVSLTIVRARAISLRMGKQAPAKTMLVTVAAQHCKLFCVLTVSEDFKWYVVQSVLCPMNTSQSG